MAIEAAKKKHMDLKSSTAGIQGFGNVGSYTAKYMDEVGVKIIAVEDHTGCIYNKDAINVKELIKYNMGNKCIKGFPGAIQVSQSVITMDIDILFPCALEKQITQENANEVKAKIICEGGKGPTTPEADKILYEKDVVVIPDILANSGGVTVSYFEWVQNLERVIWSFDKVQLKQKETMIIAFEEIWV